jgi:hypothetical protein
MVRCGEQRLEMPIAGAKLGDGGGKLEWKCPQSAVRLQILSLVSL